MWPTVAKKKIIYKCYFSPTKENYSICPLRKAWFFPPKSQLIYFLLCNKNIRYYVCTYELLIDIFIETELQFPEKIKQKKISVFFFFAKIAFFRIWLLKNEALLSNMLLIFKTCKDLNYNSYLAQNSVSFFVDL